MPTDLPARPVPSLFEPGAWRRAILAIGLSWIAGFVDVVGYLAFVHVYTANMSGNTVALGIGLADRKWGEVALRAAPLLGFVFGLFVAALFWTDRRRALSHRAAKAFGFELLVLTAFIVLTTAGHPVARDSFALCAYISLLAFAMGVQNGSLSHVGSETVHTTHVTGALKSLMLETATLCLWLMERLRAPERPRSAGLWREAFNLKCVQRMRLLGGMWTAYLVGGVCGALGWSRWQFFGLIPPAVALLVVVVSDLIQPLLDEGRGS